MDEKPIGYRLNESARLFNELVKKMMTRRGISRTYFEIISYLKRHDGVAITQKDICEYLMMRPSTISLTLQKMEYEGLIARKKDLDDCRKMIITLTSKGEAKGLEFRSIFKSCDDILLDSISVEEKDELYKILEKLNERMDGEI